MAGKGSRYVVGTWLVGKGGWYVVGQGGRYVVGREGDVVGKSYRVVHKVRHVAGMWLVNQINLFTLPN